MTNNPLQFSIPNSPLTDDEYRTLLMLYNTKGKLYDWLERNKRTGVFTPEQIAQQKAQLDDAIKKAKGLIDAYADLHPNVR
jgi:hypothetical protein